MKTIYLLIVIFLFTQHSLYPKQSTDTVTSLTVDSIKNKQDSLTNAKIINATADSIAKKSVAETSCVCQYSEPKDWNFGLWALIFLPIFIFIVVIGVLFFTGLAKFEIAEALKENELTKVTIPNPQYTGQQANAGQTDVPITMEVTANVSYIPAVVANAAATPPIPASNARYEIKDAEKIYRPSISRYIAFISSLLIIIIAVCISSFFIYHYIRTGCPPELGALTTVLVGLGIGIVPYAVNKVSAAVSGKEEK